MEFEKYSKNLSYSYAYGAFVTLELLKAKKDKVIAILVDESFTTNEAFLKIQEATKNSSIKIIVDNKTIQKIRPKGNIYVIGVFKKYTFDDLSNQAHVLLNEIEDKGQIGTIIRSMNGFSFTNLVLVNDQIDIFDPQLIRASMGSIFHITIKLLKDFNEYIKLYPSNNILIIEKAEKSDKFNLKKENNLTLVFTNNKIKYDYQKIFFNKNIDLENIVNIILYSLY